MRSDWPFKLLRWFCPDHLYEEIEGDLIQKFERQVKVFGENKAKIAVECNSIFQARDFV